jgi:dTDP-4-amino-4,6-dideoxygalactose transaminase
MWGDVGVLSFGGSKLVTSGRGGAVLTNRDDVAQRIRLYAHRGNDAYPLSEMQAAVLLPQFDALAERHRRRSANVARLLTLLEAAGCPSDLRNVSHDSSRAWYKLALRFAPESLHGLTRNQFAQAVRAEGIALDPGFPGLHRIHGKRRFRAVGDLPHATAADEQTLVLHHPVLLGDENDLRQIIEAVDKIRRHATMVRQAME